MMIAPAFHRQGLGKVLLQQSEEELFNHYRELVLECFAGNAQALNFYRKNGWTETGKFFDENLKQKKILLKKFKV